MQQPIYVHPVTHEPLTRQGDTYVSANGESFPIVKDVPHFLPADVIAATREERTDFINALKTFLRKYPRVYLALILLVSPVCFTGTSASSFLKRFGKDALMLNVGSGVHRPHPRIINIDIFAYERVDVVADAARLPFASHSADVVVCESLLEHVPDPRRIVEEMFRVLKPGGVLYIVVPFVYPFHACPNDFYRWSETGVKELLSHGEIENIGTRAGPTSALTGALATWAAIAFSFGSTSLYNVLSLFFAVLFAPLKILDLIFGWFPTSIHAAGQFYAVARKKA